MTEEIKYNKDEKWIPYKQLAETPQQTIARLEQENFALTQESQQKSQTICELEQENKKLKYLISEEQCFEEGCNKCTKAYYTDDKYRSALEEIRDINKLFFERKYGYPEDLIKIDNIINEVLQ